MIQVLLPAVRRITRQEFKCSDEIHGQVLVESKDIEVSACQERSSSVSGMEIDSFH